MHTPNKIPITYLCILAFLTSCSAPSGDAKKRYPWGLNWTSGGSMSKEKKQKVSIKRWNKEVLKKTTKKHDVRSFLTYGLFIIICLHNSRLPVQYAALARPGCLVERVFSLFLPPTQQKIPLYTNSTFSAELVKSYQASI